MSCCTPNRALRINAHFALRKFVHSAPGTNASDLPVGRRLRCRIRVPCPALLIKIFLFFRNANQMYISLRPASTRGAARDRHERGAGCGGRFGAFDEWRARRTAKTCGSDAPTLASSLRRHPASDGGKKARLTRKSTKETVKTIARGMPGVSGVTVVTNSSCFLFSHARLRAH